MSEKLSPEQLQCNTLHYYESHAVAVEARTQLQHRADWYQPFLALLPAGAHILDAGCGAGYDSLYFIQQGFALTAFDASASLANLASQRIRKPVLRLKFEEITFDHQFDGIWACAALLHVPRLHLTDVLKRLGVALQHGGILYANFVYGEGETERGGLLFNDYTETSFREVIAMRPGLEIVQVWKTGDLPPARPDREWLHALLKKRIENDG